MRSFQWPATDFAVPAVHWLSAATGRPVAPRDAIRVRQVSGLTGEDYSNHCPAMSLSWSNTMRTPTLPRAYVAR